MSLAEAYAHMGERLQRAEDRYARGRLDTMLIFADAEKAAAYGKEREAAWAEFRSAVQRYRAGKEQA